MPLDSCSVLLFYLSAKFSNFVPEPKLESISYSIRNEDLKGWSHELIKGSKDVQELSGWRRISPIDKTWIMSADFESLLMITCL